MRTTQPLLIAELSGNHNGKLDGAFALIEAAKAAGADAVKFQTYTPDTLTILCDRPEFRVKGGLWDGKTLYELYEWAHTPWEWHRAMFKRAHELGLLAFSTPFDETSVDFLEALDNPIYKVASFELIDLDLIRKVAATGKPLVMSTGMATLEEIGGAVTAARNAGCQEITLLHCVSGYPTPVEECHVRSIVALRERFGCPVGLSDHSLGLAAAAAATALGAVMIEKHLTLRRADGGPDAAFSLEPNEFRLMVDTCRDVAKSLGEANFAQPPCEQASTIFRRSLFVTGDLVKGDVFTKANVRAIRPGYGLAPKHLSEVLGRRAACDIERGTPLSWGLLA
jgi:N-acetylneuraminate synthase